LERDWTREEESIGQEKVRPHLFDDTKSEREGSEEEEGEAEGEDE